MMLVDRAIFFMLTSPLVVLKIKTTSFSQQLLAEIHVHVKGRAVFDHLDASQHQVKQSTQNPG
jgi:hypothetical protein